MEHETFRTRVAALIQKSRKAIRLYSSVGRGGNAKQSEFTEAQVQEWKDVNVELLHSLGAAIESPGNRQLAANVFALRDRFYNEWRMAEAELHSKHKELLYVVENADFAKAAGLSRRLVVLKARVQATQAAHHELQDLIDQSRVAQPTIELSQEHIVKEERVPEVTIAKVIPLRRKSVG